METERVIQTFNYELKDGQYVQIKFEISAPGELTGVITREATGDIYEILSKEMKNELGKMAKQMTGDIKSLPPSARTTIDIDKTKSEVSEMTDDLDAVVHDTEIAANEIFDSIEIIETNLDFCTDILNQAEKLDLEEEQNRAKIIGFIKQISKIMDTDRQQLTTIIQTLSFQDLTGQKIKKIIRMLQGLQSNLMRLFLTVNFGMKSIEEEPIKDFDELRKKAAEETDKAMMELKGASEYGLRQDSVDKLLSDLGF